MFRHKCKNKWKDCIRSFFIPSMSWKRLWKYYKTRLVRLSGTPHVIALGCAIGCFVSFLPLIGFHFILSCVLSWILGASILASLVGTVVGNPITFPLIWFSSYEIGNFLLRMQVKESFNSFDKKIIYFHIFSSSWNDTYLFLLHAFLPLMLGGSILGFIFGSIVYYVVYSLVTLYQKKKRKNENRMTGL